MWKLVTKVQIQNSQIQKLQGLSDVDCIEVVLLDK
jgi:hypothetical protein